MDRFHSGQIMCNRDINTIRTLLVNISNINQMLGRIREVKFYHQTLDMFIREGLEILMGEQRYRIVVADDTTSEGNQVHMVYDDNESSKSSDSSDSSDSKSNNSDTFDLRHKGTCEKCQTIRIIGT
jgi:hypothetical protein